MSTKENPVEIKGQKEGLWIFLDDQLALYKVFAALEDKLASSNNFFHGAEVTIDTGTRLLTTEEKKELRAIVESTHALHIKELSNIGKPKPSSRASEPSGEDALETDREDAISLRRDAQEYLPDADTRDEDPSPSEPGYDSPPPGEQAGKAPESDTDDEFMKFLDETFRIPVKGHWEEKETYSSDYLYENEETAFYFRGTVRSGQSLEFPGNIIILGDVNPGAYVVASGDIIVMGRLHGVVHAGAEGEERAVAIGMNFRPSQLRIAQYIGRPPDEGPRARKKRPQAEKAYIKDGAIVIEPLL